MRVGKASLNLHNVELASPTGPSLMRDSRTPLPAEIAGIEQEVVLNGNETEE